MKGNKIMPRKLTTEQFVENAKKFFPNYDYSRVVYVNNNTKVIIGCPTHSWFEQLPRTLISNIGCPKCTGRYMDTTYFKEKARNIHGDKYDYDLVEYTNNISPVKIKCPKHGIFEQTPNAHLSGRKSGCQLCANEKKSIEGRKLVFGIGINDYDGYVGDNGNMIPSYDCWVQMLRRCYSDKKKAEAPSYEGCYVSEDWIRFDKFRIWFDKHYRVGYCLDKDWIFHGNKEYSEGKCCFIPPLINTILTKCNTMRGDTPIGVGRKGNKFSARLAKNNKQVYLGTFFTMEDAFNAYKKEKESFIKELAEEYYSDGRIDKIVYDAMMRYEVLIDD